MSGSIGDGGASRLSILGDMQEREHRRQMNMAEHEETSDVVRHPRPAVKPRRDAQWDEAAGRWEVWSDTYHGWVSLEDGTVQKAGTRSVDPVDAD